MFRVEYYDTVTPDDTNLEFETEKDMYEWINETMETWYENLCEQHPDADVVWLNRLLDSGNETEIYIPDTSITVSCKII